MLDQLANIGPSGIDHKQVCWHNLEATHRGGGGGGRGGEGEEEEHARDAS